MSCAAPRCGFLEVYAWKFNRGANIGSNAPEGGYNFHCSFPRKGVVIESCIKATICILKIYIFTDYLLVESFSFTRFFVPPTKPPSYSRRVWRVQPANIVIYYKFILFVLKGLFCQDDVEATYVSICFSCI